MYAWGISSSTFKGTVVDGVTPSKTPCPASLGAGVVRIARAANADRCTSSRGLINGVTTLEMDNGITK